MSEHEPDETELLLTQYKELRQEIRNSVDLAKERLTKGITAVGFIAAYAGYRAHYSLFLLVPVIVLALLSTYFFSMYWVQKLSYQVAKIELELDTLGFDWERQVLLDGTNISTPRAEKMAHGGMYGFYGLIVLTLTVVSLLVSFQGTTEIDLFRIAIGFDTVLGLYALLFALCAMTFYSFDKERRETERKITSEQRDKAVSASKQYLRKKGSATPDDFRANVFPPYAQLYEFGDWWEMVSEKIATDDDFRPSEERDGYCYLRSEERQEVKE